YGHGAVTVARAALDGGATGLCVAMVQEGVRLREAGIDAPVLVLSEQSPDDMRTAVQHDLQLTVYSGRALDIIADAGGVQHPVHLKIDTGMHRVGASPDDAVALADAIASSAAVGLAGVCTHLAVADEPDHPYTRQQLDLFDRVLDQLSAAGHRVPLVHAGNSAGAIVHPRARYSMVRPGIAIYGVSPGHGVDHLVEPLGLQPAMALKARVSHVQRRAAGESLSYGLRHTFAADTTVATVPLGYADGVARRFSAVGGEVLVGGRRCPVVGVVTMDQLMVDVGDQSVQVGDEVVLIGRQGPEVVTATEWADRLGTIAYEVLCAVSARVPRVAV
ncbi:MAG: alanine racemase, partial [Actinomycetota bacterium]